MLQELFHAQCRTTLGAPALGAWVCGALLVGAGALGAGVLSGCSDPGEPQEAAFVPANYQTEYERVRGCRLSVEHGLSYIEIYAEPDAAVLYQAEDYPFEPGMLIVKAEFADEDCSDLSGFTVMRKAQPGEHESEHGWEWHTLDRNRRPIDTNVARCTACHAGCPERDFACALP